MAVHKDLATLEVCPLHILAQGPLSRPSSPACQDGDVPYPAPRRLLEHRGEDRKRRSTPSAPCADRALDSAGPCALDADQDPGRGCVRDRGEATQSPAPHPGGGCADGVCLAHVTGLHIAAGSCGDRSVDRARGARSLGRPRDPA